MHIRIRASESLCAVDPTSLLVMGPSLSLEIDIMAHISWFVASTGHKQTLTLYVKPALAYCGERLTLGNDLKYVFLKQSIKQNNTLTDDKVNQIKKLPLWGSCCKMSHCKISCSHEAVTFRLRISSCLWKCTDLLTTDRPVIFRHDMTVRKSNRFVSTLLRFSYWIRSMVFIGSIDN